MAAMRASESLYVKLMANPGVVFTLEAIYRTVAREPLEGLTVAELHSRCARAIGQARAKLKASGYVLVKGELRHSYKAVKRTR